MNIREQNILQSANKTALDALHMIADLSTKATPEAQQGSFLRDIQRIANTAIAKATKADRRDLRMIGDVWLYNVRTNERLDWDDLGITRKDYAHAIRRSLRAGSGLVGDEGANIEVNNVQVYAF
jgi:hypothetical protein